MKVVTSAWQVVSVAGSSGPVGQAEDAGTQGRLAGSGAGGQGAGRAPLTPPAPKGRLGQHLGGAALDPSRGAWKLSFPPDRWFSYFFRGWVGGGEL